jgi:hypothetical protein
LIYTANVSFVDNMNVPLQQRIPAVRVAVLATADLAYPAEVALGTIEISILPVTDPPFVIKILDDTCTTPPEPV